MLDSRPRRLIVVVLLAAGLGRSSSGEDIPASSFVSEAREVLPVEPSYAYHRTLASEPVHRPRRDPSARPEVGELAIDPEGWSLLFPEDAGPALRQAVEDCRDYFERSMSVRLSMESRGSLRDWADLKRVIIVGSREQLPGLGASLTGSKDYRIQAGPDRVVVCGFDEAGGRFGLYNLEARMNLREAPFLPGDLDTTRRSLYQTRMALSWLGWMEWPDAYLSHMAHDGFDAIYASVYANPNGVAGPPHYDRIRKQDPARLQDLIRRAARFGIKVYTPILYDNTGEPGNEEGLRALVRDIVARFPGIHGYVLLTEGFMYQGFRAGHVRNEDEIRDWARHWCRAVEVVAEECHRVNPDIEILPWEYNIDFRPQRAAVKADVIGLMPKDTIPLITWENGTSFELDGMRGYLRDYSISQIGPAEAAKAQLDRAKARGMQVYSKVDTFATWQFGTTPYLPCPQQWQIRYDALARSGISGTLESWSNGYKPNLMTELRAWSCWGEAPANDDLLRSYARRDFGPGQEDLVLDAWDHFSRAVRLVPDTGPSMGTNFALANPLFFQEPEPRTMTLEHSWWDETQWKNNIRGSKMNPYWPYTHSRMVFYPDFTNRANRAEQYARSSSGIGALADPGEAKDSGAILPTFNKYLSLAADELEAGSRTYREAARRAPREKRRGAFREAFIAEQMQNMLRSDRAVLEFEDLRFRLATGGNALEAGPILDRLEEIAAEELARTRLALEIAQRDSRLGYEMEQDYVYRPFVLREKIEVLEQTLADRLPSYRREHRLPDTRPH